MPEILSFGRGAEVEHPTIKAIKNALTKLSAPQREVVLLYYFYQYTAKEIAQMTNTPLPTIKSRIGTAKKILARYLREDFQ